MMSFLCRNILFILWTIFNLLQILSFLLHTVRSQENWSYFPHDPQATCQYNINHCNINHWLITSIPLSSIFSITLPTIISITLSSITSIKLPSISSILLSRITSITLPSISGITLTNSFAFGPSGISFHYYVIYIWQIVPTLPI